jgi:hypothetical protein
MVGGMQVLAAGDMCAICQEKMHAPISLCCKHVFCEDCVSEWYYICPVANLASCKHSLKNHKLKCYSWARKYIWK